YPSFHKKGIFMSLRARVQTHRTVLRSIAALPGLLTLLFVGSVQSGLAQDPPLNIFKNYIVTGDYVAAGWVEQSSANGLATGTISIPDSKQAQYTGAASPSVPTGADIVAAYLYWSTVEGNQSSFVGHQAYF